MGFDDGDDAWLAGDDDDDDDDDARWVGGRDTVLLDVGWRVVGDAHGWILRCPVTRSVIQGGSGDAVETRDVGRGTQRNATPCNARPDETRQWRARDSAGAGAGAGAGRHRHARA